MAQAKLTAPITAAIQTYVNVLTHRFGAQLVDVLLFGSQAHAAKPPLIPISTSSSCSITPLHTT